MTAHGAGRGRSPLLSLMFPTVKDKVAILEKEKVINRGDLMSQRPQFLSNNELERMVKLETKTRQSRYLSTAR
jgi:hypothetical protein